MSNNQFINRERMLRDFTDIVSIDSPSLKERKLAEVLRIKLETIGFTVYEDNAGEKAGGECGNLIAWLPPYNTDTAAIPPTTLPPAYMPSSAMPPSDLPSSASPPPASPPAASPPAASPPAALPVTAMLAHMDTVGPCENKRWIVEGDIVRSDGATILGGDDGAGIVATLEIARRVIEENIPHGGILIIYTIAEETGLDGAKNLDLDLIKTILRSDCFPEFCYVFDSGGPPGSVVSRAPSHTDVIITVNGIASHAGIEPDKGINAIVALSEAIAQMPLGRIDHETTANIGIIKGGLARNVVCAAAVAEGEARSHNSETLARQVAAMKECVASACKRRGASFDFKEISSYNAFALTPDDPIIMLLSEAARACGHELDLIPTGGGSDASVLNAMGIPAANLPVGMYKVHSVEEYTNLRETAETVELIIETFRQLSRR